MLKRILDSGWELRSSDGLNIYGEKISSPSYKAEGWYPVTVPGTVVAGLVENEEYPDPYYNKNISQLPGYKVGKDSLFSNHYMPDDSPFRSSWWYRNIFEVPEEWQGRKIWVEFKGINYSANIWLNRKRIAGTGEVQGTYRLYKFDVSNNIKPGKKNVIAVEVFAPQPDDLALTFIDWNPVTPDDSMGIWQPVELHLSEEIALQNTFVRSKVSQDLQKTELEVRTELYNDTKEVRTLRLSGEIKEKMQKVEEGKSIEFEKELTIGPREKKEIIITSEECPVLKIKNPRLWWPYQMGNPELYQLNLKVFQDGESLSDEEEISFGIRQIDSYLNEKGSRVFIINGKKIQLRGAAWTPDMMLRQSDLQDEIDLSYVKNMNFNTVRLEGKLASDHFWEVCDREGILVIAGWPCCNHWEKWDRWKAEDLRVAVESLRSQLKRLRNHPALTAWFYGSDFPPVYEVEREYLKVIETVQPDIPAVSSAADKPTKITGEPGVKMSGPYNYVPPQYWYDPDMQGVAGKFNTETGPDLCIPQLDSLRKMLAPEELKNDSEGWNLHAGLAAFTDTSVQDRVVKGRFGDDLSFEKYVKAVQILGYQSWRAMYEAHLRNWPEATGVIGWMLNSSWPSLIWQLYDYYNLPNGAFYGSKKGCEPLHLQFSYDDNTVVLAKQTFENYDKLRSKYGDLTAKIVIYDLEQGEVFSKETVVDTAYTYGTEDIYQISEEYLKELNTTRVLFLYLNNKEGNISKNVYYIPAGRDVYDNESDVWFHRPLKEFASLEGLQGIPAAEVELNYNLEERKEAITISVELKNQSNNIACFNQIKLYDSDGKIITPVYWSDNFLTLLPAEKESIMGIIKKSEIGIWNLDNIKVVLDSWN